MYVVSGQSKYDFAQHNSVAFLPSSFAMYANTLGFAYAIRRSTNEDMRRTLFATLSFAAGAIVGWPFALAVAIPFVFEELFLAGGDKVTPEIRGSWLIARWRRMATCGAIASLLFVRPGILRFSLSSYRRNFR